MSDQLSYSLNLDVKPLVAAIREAMGTVETTVGETQAKLGNFEPINTESINKASSAISGLGQQATQSTAQARQGSNNLKIGLEQVTREAGELKRNATDAMKGVGQGATQARPPVGRLGDEMARVDATTAKAGSQMRTFINVAAGIVGVTVGVAGLQAGIAAVVRTGASFETLGVTLNSLTGSAEKGGQAMAWIQDFVANTPLQLEGVTQAFIKMTAFGMEPMNGAMQSLVDINALYGGSQVELDGIINAVGKSWSKQSLQTQEAIMLIERGIPVWKLLSDALGKTEVEIQEMATAGELGRDAIQVLLDQMGEVGQGAALAQMESWSGLVSNMGDTWTSFLNDIAKSGTLDYFKEQLESLLATIKQMADSGELADMAKNVSDAIVTLMSSIKAVIVTIYEWRTAILAGVAALAGLKLLGLIASLGSAVAVFKAATASIAAFRTALMGLNPALVAVAGTIASFKLGGFAAELALVKTGFLDWAYGASVATKETQAMVDRMNEFKPQLDELSKIKIEAETAGLDALSDELDQLRRDLILGKEDIDSFNQSMERIRTSINDSIETTKQEQKLKDLAEKAKQEHRELVQEKDRLEEDMLNRRIAREEDENRRLSERSLEDRKRSLEAEAKDTIDSKRRAIEDVKRLEQKAVEDIERIKRGAMNESIGIEEQMMRIRRDGLSGMQREVQLREDIATFTERANRSIKEGDTDTARNYMSRINSLTSEISATQEKVAALADLNDMNKRIAQAEKEQVNQTLTSAQKQTATVREQSKARVKTIEDEIEQINALLSELESQREIPVDVEDQQAIDRLTEIEKRLDELKKGVSIPIATTGGVAVKGYNTGGRIPGFGGGDIVPAMLEPGEYVIRKEMVQRYGVDFIESINRGMAGASRPSSITIPRIPRYNTGGLVAGQTSETVRLEISGGGKTSQLSGSRFDVDTLVSQLRKMEIAR